MLEIAVQDPEGIAVARDHGADRIELCTALALGGLTPSRALIDAAVASGLPTHVLVRPRAGDFTYSSVERAVLLADVRVALEAGAHGVVIGALREGGVDTDLVAGIRAEAADVDVTFHRAFDVVADRGATLQLLAELGVDRILTSGGADRAPDACEELARLVALADGRIQVMAGSGIDASTVWPILATGVDAVHASAKRLVSEPLAVRLGGLATAGAFSREVTDPGQVAALRAAVDSDTHAGPGR